MKATNKSQNPSEEDIILNSKLNCLYSHDFGDGRFFQLVFEDENTFEFKVATRTMLKVVYIKEKKDIEGIEIIKLIDGKEKQRLKFNKFNLQQLKAFLKFISELDLKGLTERRIQLESDHELDDKTKKTIKTILSSKNGESVIKELIGDGVITNEDIVNTGYRKKEFGIFKRLLNDPNYWKEYGQNELIKEKKEEKIWQYFFMKNQWIFGYGLDYKYKGILQKEFYASEINADGSNAVITDFLLADQRFTTFVEIKRPSSPIFKQFQNRSKSWKLSNDLVESVSQILEQKASGQVKIENEELFTEDGELITQKAIDSKVILLIGNLNREEINKQNDREWAYKLRTFELFRRDSRNIEIMTYDELYERAKYIIHNSNVHVEENKEDNNEYFDEIENLPF